MVNLEAPSVQFEVVLVVEGVVHAASVGELDDAFALPLVVNVGVGNLPGGAEVVLQILERNKLCSSPRFSHREMLPTAEHHLKLVLTGCGNH